MGKSQRVVGDCVGFHRDTNAFILKKQSVNIDAEEEGCSTGARGSPMSAVVKATVGTSRNEVTVSQCWVWTWVGLGGRGHGPEVLCLWGGGGGGSGCCVFAESREIWLFSQ